MASACIVGFESLIRATAAQVLVLDHNCLGALDVVCALPRLEKLSAAHNSLAALPAGMHHLRKLRELNVASNQLAALPDALGACESLELIDAADNRIQVRLNTKPGCVQMHQAQD